MTVRDFTRKTDLELAAEADRLASIIDRRGESSIADVAAILAEMIRRLDRAATDKPDDRHPERRGA